MSSIPNELSYTKEHEWVHESSPTIIRMGITDYAQGHLGDVVFVDLPDSGRAVTKGGEAAVVESVKAASDIVAPIAGVITAVNDELPDNPVAVNDDAMAAWFFRIKPAAGESIDGFMDEAAYQALIG